MNSSSVNGHLYSTKDVFQGAFVFTTTTKPKISVRSINKQDLLT